nr:hypothetical protein CFP56_65674 [Quercus suber]
MDWVKADTVAEFQMSQPYFDELGVQYGDSGDVLEEEETNLGGTEAIALMVDEADGQGEEEVDGHLTQLT